MNTLIGFILLAAAAYIAYKVFFKKETLVQAFDEATKETVAEVKKEAPVIAEKIVAEVKEEAPVVEAAIVKAAASAKQSFKKIKKSKKAKI